MLKIRVQFLILFLPLIIGCVNNNVEQRRRVAVTILPQKYLLDKIVGDSLEVVCLIPEGANPEEYSATPRLMAEIATSSLYFKVGELGFEKTTLPSILENMSHVQVVTLSDDIEFITSQCSHGGEEHSHYDPHYWSSPKMAKIMATNMYNSIKEFDAANSSYYEKNYLNLISELDSVDFRIEEILLSSTNRQFAIFHPSLSYFARDYGLQQLSLEQNGKAMAPRTMKQTIEKAIKGGVQTVFVQNEFSPEQVKTFAQEIGANVVVINPLAYNFIEEINKVAHAIAK